MATFCDKLKHGLVLNCERPSVKRYAQETVLIPYESIDRTASAVEVDYTDVAPKHRVSIVLKEGEKGVLFKLNRNAKLITAMYSKSTEEESGLPVYNHQSTITAHGADEMTKSILATLDLGRVVAVNKFETATGNLYEVSGWQNGLTTGDYDYDITGSNGVVPIVLESGDDFLESHIPYVFKSETPGQEDLDFEALFENPTT